MTAGDRPQVPESGDGCLCCRNQGVLPTPQRNGMSVPVSGFIDGTTILQCCEECIGALFLGGTHPHELNIAGILGGIQ